MEDPRQAWRSSALLWFFLVCFCCKEAAVVDASHVVYRSLQSMEPPTVGTKHRTGYHFQPRKNWINDPNGPMYYKGYYHLFYQYNPKGAVWGNIVWAHSVSKDLINWTPLPPAIYPTDSFDVNGCWSGSATILPDGRPVIFYTGINPDHHQVQNVAFPSNLSDPFLVEWSKPAYNPLIVSPPGINVTFFRDPTTAWLGPDRHWRVVVGSKRKHRGMAFLYRSRDFRTWVRAHHPLHSSAGTGMWECPDFYPVSVAGEEGVETSAGLGPGYRHVLKVSLDLTRYEYYTVGTYDMFRDRYVPDAYLNDDHTGLRYDYGNYYASKTFFDESKRRRILWGWSNESDSVISDNNKGWAGIQTIPRKIWLDQGGRQLLQWPVEELEQLRGDEVRLAGVQLKSGGSIHRVEGFQTSEADVEVTFLVNDLEKAEPFDPSWKADPQRLCGMKGADVKGGVGPFGLLVLATGDRSEQTAVLFRIFKGQGKHVVLTCHDPSRSTSMSGVYKPSYGGFVDVDIAMDKKLSMRVLVDNSVVESFAAGGKTCITSRVYPVLAEGQSSNLFAFNNGESDIVVSELRAWHMKRPLSMN